jgi:hypothetical protein
MDKYDAKDIIDFIQILVLVPAYLYLMTRGIVHYISGQNGFEPLALGLLLFIVHKTTK